MLIFFNFYSVNFEIDVFLQTLFTLQQLESKIMKKAAITLLLVFFAGLILSSCRARAPKCSQPYSKVEKPTSEKSV